MVTSAVTGKAGSISVGATTAEVFAWTMDRNTEAVEATSMDSGGNREYIVGLFGWSGTYSTLRFANRTGSQAAATFQVGASVGTATPTFKGGVIITNEPISCPVDGRVEYAYTFTGTGACTAATS